MKNYIVRIFTVCFLVVAGACPFYGQTGAHRVSQVIVKGNGIAANVGPGAKIFVCAPNTGCATAANIYLDAGLTTPAQNPVTADGSGNYDYYIASGCVDEQISSPGQGIIFVPNVCPFNGQGGGNPSFSAITSGVNSQASMTVGSGASLGHSGSGTNDASSINGVAITGTPSAGQSPVATGSAAATWQTPAASFPPTQANTYLVGEGDSRMSPVSNGGPNWLPSQNLISQIMLQSNFSGSAGSVNLAVGGSSCSAMTSRYATGAHNYRPGGSMVPANVTKSLLIIEVGVNDLRINTSAIAEETCMMAYITNAIADGFTVIPMTVYWFDGYTSAQQTQAQIYNDWLRQLPGSGRFPRASLPFVFDFDLFFPAETNNPYWLPATTITAISSVTVTSNVASFVTATQSFLANDYAYISGYTGAAACLNGQYIPVSATGLSSTTFQGPVGCPDLTGTTGTAQYGGNVTNGGTGLHMGPPGITLAAQNFNAVYTIAQTGVMMTQPNGRSYYKPPSGFSQIDGCLHVGAMGDLPKCQSAGTLYSRLSSDPAKGLLELGNSTMFAQGASGWNIQMVAGPYSIAGGTGPWSYQGGSVVAAVTGVTLPTLPSGSLTSCLDISCTTGLFNLGAQTISNDATKMTVSLPFQIKNTAPPTCVASLGGTFQYTHTNATTKDVVQVCAQDASGVYAWRTIY